MKIFKKKEKELYWNPKDIDETNAVYRIVIGKRSNGKSFGTVRKAIDAFLEEGLPSAYLRRYEEEIRPKNIGDLLAPHYEYISKKTKGKYNTVTYRTNHFVLAYQEDGEIKYKDDKPIIYTRALNTALKYKGQDVGQLAYIIFDEFLTRDLYLKDEFVIFANMISTLVRDREIKAIYMLGNTVTRYCPYWEEMLLTHVNEQEQGSIEIYTYNNDKLTVAVEYCADTENTKNIEHYYAFDSPQLEMITSGSFEEAKYPHICELDWNLSEETFVYKFLVDFNGYKTVGEIHRNKDDIVLCFHAIGNSNYKWSGKDIVFTTERLISPLWQNSFGKGDTPVHKLIRQLIREDRLYFSNNSVGERVLTFIKYCKTQGTF